MALLTQTPDGLVDYANGYTTVAALRAYASDRGVDLASSTDEALGVAIIAATDFIDAAYSFIGRPRRREQGTAWPRTDIPNLFLYGLPVPLVKACHQLALRVARGTPLSVDPTVDPTGQAVSELTVKVGPIEKSTKFAVSGGGPTSVPSVALSARFPEVELGLRRAGLLVGSGGAGSGSVKRG